MRVRCTDARRLRHALSLIHILLQKILRFLDYIIKGSYKAGGNKHIFTDQELYEEYNLTDDEINIIGSVIKERK